MFQLSKLFSRRPPPAQFSVEKLDEMFRRHSFKYAGYRPAGIDLSDDEGHLFARSDCTFHVFFALHRDFGVNTVYIGETAPVFGAGRFENLVYFADYRELFNQSMEAGLSRDESFALALDGHIEYAARLFQIIVKNGRRVPTNDDRAAAEASSS